MNEPETRPEILTVEGLRISIRTDEGLARVLDRIDLRVPRGHVVGIVGESGCGKSTLVRAIIGILPAGAQIEAGEILFEGRDMLALGEAGASREVRGSRIGLIPQDPYLAMNPLFSVGAQVMEIMRWHAPRDGRRGRALSNHFRSRLIGLFRRVQLPDPELALDRYPHQFSGGQRQRILIAAALACSPSLVIADEPTTALDVTTQQQILDLLRELVDEFGLSMLFVTHDLGVVAELCDEVNVVYAGQTVESDATETLLAEPLHPYTRALIACHPERAEGFVGIPGEVSSPLHPPPGCRFAPRCTQVRPDCTLAPPPFYSIAGRPGRHVACVLYETAARQEIPA